MRTQVPAAVADRSSTSLASPSRRPRSRLIVAAVAGAPLHLKRPLVVLAFAAGAALVAPSAASAAASPSARCTDGLTKLELRLGDGIPLPSSYSNPTSSSVTFNLRVASSAFFGPAHVAGSVTLPPHTGRLKSSVLPTYLHTPMGGGQVTIEVRTNRTGAEVVGRCRYQVSLTAPPPVQAGTPRHPVTRWLLQVPVQLCAIEGSQAAGPARPGQTVPAGRLFSTLAAANEIWYPQAQVAFSSSTSSVIPVIADPTPPNGANGELGDLQLDLKVDGLDPAMACVRAWQARWPGRRGIPVVAARAVLGQPATRGFAPPPPRGLQTASHFPGVALEGTRCAARR